MDQFDDSTLAPASPSFESLKKQNKHGVEYWSARELQSCLGYTEWRKFKNAIKKAIESCEQSGNDPSHHLVGAAKQIQFGKGATQVFDDYHLSRFACYLIAQNGDPRKPEIAQAQKYFAIQTRRQEISDQMAADLERLEARQQASVEFKALSGAAKEAGVQNAMFGIFHDAGYTGNDSKIGKCQGGALNLNQRSGAEAAKLKKLSDTGGCKFSGCPTPAKPIFESRAVYKGLYGGLGVDAIKARKGIAPKEQLMDRMDTTELAANLFRMTQTKDKLKKENIKNQRDAIETHEAVGKRVRAAIEEIGGTMPENIQPAEPIRSVEKRIKSSKPKLVLDTKDNLGVISSGEQIE